MKVVGYTYSDGSELCPEHAEERGFEDENSETGECGAIFSTDEAEFDRTCDIRHSDGFHYVILERNM